MIELNIEEWRIQSTNFLEGTYKIVENVGFLAHAPKNRPTFSIFWGKGEFCVCSQLQNIRGKCHFKNISQGGGGGVLPLSHDYITNIEVENIRIQNHPILD